MAELSKFDYPNLSVIPTSYRSASDSADLEAPDSVIGIYCTVALWR